MASSATRLSTLVIDYVGRKPVRAGHVAPACTVLAIYSHNAKTWRVSELDAWIEDDEDSYSVALPADARGHDVELACSAIEAAP